MGTSPRSVIVVTGGDPVPAAVALRLPLRAAVVAADSGLQHAIALGLAVDVVVGDMDSVDPALLARAEAAGARVERHPAAKDATDTELALGAARAEGATRVVLVGGEGGRLDHFLANALLLASPRFADLEVEAWWGDQHVVVVRRHARLEGRPGDMVSLLPVGGPACGVVTDGLLYPLRGEDLAPGSTRGVSNELLGPEASVTLAGGCLLAVLPGVAGTHLLADATATGPRREVAR